MRAPRPAAAAGKTLTFSLTRVLVLFMSNERMEIQARHGEILAEVADLSLKLARKLHERAMAAETEEEVQAAASAFHRISRSLRQTLALEARLERDSRRDAIEARRFAEEDRRERLKARKAHVGNVGSRLIWTEAERDDIGRLLVDLKRWCDEEAFHEERFLSSPVEAVIARLKRDLGLASPPPLPVNAETPAEPAPPDRWSSA